jgi:mediator of replication checkpoint protein 1
MPHSDRERASDEKQVEKLFRDITSGMLRRKRGADYDLSDSDDGGEARRRMKRRQFAKMQKALFADERISKVAENPKTQAFLRTIEDRGDDEEMDFLFETPAPESEDTQTSSQSTDIVVPASQPQERLPAAQRRTKPSKKPTTIGDIRASLSNLLEEDFIPSTSQVIPGTASDASDAEDDDEDEDTLTTANKENTHPNVTTGGTNPRRSGPRPQVIDRISLKRNSSSNLSTTSSTTSSTGRQAFTTATASASSFNVPALLRKATTNASSFSGPAPSHSITGGGGGGGAGGFGEESKIKRNAGKKSGINYFARENERRAALAESEKRREARKVRGAEGRSDVVKGLFGGGKFE